MVIDRCHGGALHQLLMKIMHRSHGLELRQRSQEPLNEWPTCRRLETNAAGLSSFEELDSFCLAAMRPIGNTLGFIILQRQGR